MKAQLWGSIAVFSVLFILAVSLDNSFKAKEWKDFYLSGEQPSSDAVNLKTCDPEKNSYFGPLVQADHGSNNVSIPKIVEQFEEIPQESWNYQIGFNNSSGADPVKWAKLLGSGWYIDWNVQKIPISKGLVHWSMVRVHEDCISPSLDVIRSAAIKFPGGVWIIGNEPDVIWQDNISPEKYAIAYHALFLFIKEADPSAKIAVGGISHATRLRLMYLDQVLQSYQSHFQTSMPVDWWTVHGYVLREERGSWGVDIPPRQPDSQGELREVRDHGDVELFKEQLKSFRRWMAERGYRDKPVALTEFGILMPASYGYPPEYIANYLFETFTWLTRETDSETGYPFDGNHLIQRWAWYSINSQDYPSANLVDTNTGNLTLVGEMFRGFILGNQR